MSAITSFVPTGVIFPFAGTSAPAGWLLCNGSAISRTTYPALFAAIGTTYGAGDGSTTFNIPNSQGVFLRGSGSQTRYTFTISSSTVSSGAIYSNNTQTFTVLNSISSGTSLITSGSGAPLASGTLTKVSGTGPATIAFSANISVAYSSTHGNSQNDDFKGHTHTYSGVSQGTGAILNSGGTSPVYGSSWTTMTSATSPTTGGTETRPASVGVNYIIKI